MCKRQAQEENEHEKKFTKEGEKPKTLLDKQEYPCYDNDVVKASHFTERRKEMKSDTFHMSMLFDFYGDLLTDKQKELFDLYYNEDLSLTEIAEHAEISRQGVRDAIIRAETILRDTEDKVGLVRKYSGYEDKLIKIREEVSYIARVNSDLRNYEIAKRTEAITKMIDELLK